MVLLFAAAVVALPYLAFRAIVFAGNRVTHVLGWEDRASPVRRFFAHRLVRSIATGVGIGFLFSLILWIGYSQETAAVMAPFVGALVGVVVPPIADIVQRAYRANRERADAFGRRLFAIFFVGYTGAALLWLSAGLTVLLATVPAFRDLFTEWGKGTNVWAEISSNIGHATATSQSEWQVTLDYLFSALNITLGIVLFTRGPGNRASRLLALGMIGTAVAFNLQGHVFREVIPVEWVKPATFYHDYFIHLTSGLAFVFALLVFPDGRFLRSRAVSYLLFVTLFIGLLSLLTVQDHTIGLLLLFGIFIPLAALTTQLSRYRQATPEARQQAKVLFAAMGVAFMAALISVVTTVLANTNPANVQASRNYFFTSPAPGTYYFFCDPHASEMRGVLTVEDPGTTIKGADPRVTLTAEHYEFDKGGVVLPPEREVSILFTNKDADYHNVSVYRDFDRTQPVFIGETFTGQSIATALFRAFRIIFAFIPVLLFSGILRFRLWDVDRLINRAAVYATLTAIIGGVYLLGVFGLASLVGASTRNPVIIVSSTLAAVGLANPVRRKVQGFIDRRFYRERYDALRTLETFTGKLRNQIELSSLSTELVGMVDRTLQPAHVALWLRDEEGAIRPVAGDGETRVAAS